MRVVETIHPNAAYRTYTCDKMFTKEHISYYDLPHEISRKASLAAAEMFENLSNIQLANEPCISKYEIRIGIIEAFAESEKDWSVIRDSVFAGIALFHGVRVSDLEITVKDNRRKFDESEREYVSVYGLYEKLEKIAIPHDFKTHREAWRNGLVKAKEADKAKANNCAEHSDNEHYWDHELMVFDAAFDTLEALKLPEK